MISLGYDAAENLLDIEFQAERSIDIKSSKMGYANFMKAESKGTYLNHEFKKAGYDYRKLSSIGEKSDLAELCC